MIEAYFEEIILLLSERPCVESFFVVKKRTTSTDGYIRLKISLINNELLEISLYCQKSENSVEIIDYRYHWQDEHGALKCRWDNCRHHKEIETFPFHVHFTDQSAGPSEKIDIQKLLEIIENTMDER